MFPQNIDCGYTLESPRRFYRVPTITGIQLLIVILMRRGMLMHANMKFRMRRRDRYECDVPHPLPLNGKYHMFCSRENKQCRVCKIGVRYDRLLRYFFVQYILSIILIYFAGIH